MHDFCYLLVPAMSLARVSPDACTRLLFEVLRGKQATNVRSQRRALRGVEDLYASVEADRRRKDPGATLTYAFGSGGARESDELVDKMGCKYNKNYVWNEGHEDDRE